MSEDEKNEVIFHIIRKKPVEIKNYWTKTRMREAKTFSGYKRKAGNGSSRLSRKSNGAGPQPIKEPDNSAFSAVGKLFMTINGKDYVGSGAAVAGSKKVFMTAGRCIYDPGTKKWAENVMFCPAFSPKNRNPDGFCAVKLITLKGWANNKDDACNIGAVVVHGDMSSFLYLLFFANNPNRRWIAAGYPAEPPYPGDTMYKTMGEYVKVEGRDKDLIEMNNDDMDGGSIGGPWLTSSGNRFYLVNGIQGFGYENSDRTNSPYFGERAYDLWSAAVANEASGGFARIFDRGRIKRK